MVPSIQTSVLYVVAIFAAFFIGLYLYVTRNFNFWKKLGVPYIKPTPFFGNLKETVLQKRCIGEHFRKIYEEQKGKPYVGVFSFDQPSLVIRNLDTVKNILVKDAQYFIDHTMTFDEELEPMFGKSLFSINGQRWRHVRTNLSPVFTSGKMKKVFNLVENCGKELIHYLDRASSDGSPVHVKEAMARFTTDSMALCAFGIDSNSLKNPDAEFRRYLRRIVEFSISKGLTMMTAFFSPALTTFFRLTLLDDETTDFLRKTVWGAVEYREKHGVVRNDFLDSLIKLRNEGKENMTTDTTRNEDTNFCIDGDDFVAQAFAFLAAGFETSSSTMNFALYELAVQPNVQHRLRTEITQVLIKHHGEMTYDAVQEMSYLDMVVSETLRKYPILPFLDRKCVSDYELPAHSGGGTVTVPAGIGVYIPVLGIHHDPEYFPEPEKFDPERFTQENKQNRPHYTHIPFGEGPRICIGMRFGLMQAKTGLIHILSHYEVTPCKDTPVSLAFDPKSFLLTTIGEIQLYFKRNSCHVTSVSRK